MKHGPFLSSRHQMPCEMYPYHENDDRMMLIEDEGQEPAKKKQKIIQELPPEHCPSLTTSFDYDSQLLMVPEYDHDSDEHSHYGDDSHNDAKSSELEKAQRMLFSKLMLQQISRHYCQPSRDVVDARLEELIRQSLRQATSAQKDSDVVMADSAIGSDDDNGMR